MLRSFVAGFLALLACGVAVPALAQDAAELVVRLQRLEGQVRQLSGQVEQLQFENNRLKEQQRKFQEDVEFRFQEGKGGARAPAATPAASPAPSAAAPSATPGSGQAPRPTRRGDAFDPAATPNAPGAPRPLGQTTASTPLSGATSPSTTPPAATGARPPAAATPDPEDTAPLDLGAAGRVANAAPPPAPRATPSVAASGTGDARTDYDAAYAYILQRQYERAEMGLRQFLQSHPRDRLVPDATYWLGETYLQRNRPREAAEQFLKVSTEYGRSGKAPDAMLKLGVALNALGARDQACATLAELDRKFPQASSSVRQGVEREQKRAKCA